MRITRKNVEKTQICKQNCRTKNCFLRHDVEELFKYLYSITNSDTVGSGSIYLQLRSPAVAESQNSWGWKGSLEIHIVQPTSQGSHIWSSSPKNIYVSPYIYLSISKDRDSTTFLGKCSTCLWVFNHPQKREGTKKSFKKSFFLVFKFS